MTESEASNIRPNVSQATHAKAIEIQARLTIALDRKPELMDVYAAMARAFDMNTTGMVRGNLVAYWEGLTK